MVSKTYIKALLYLVWFLSGFDFWLFCRSLRVYVDLFLFILLSTVFLNLKIAVFHQLWKILCHYQYFFEYYLLPFLFCPSTVSVRHMLDLFISLNFTFIVVCVFFFVILCNLGNTSNQFTYCFFKFVWSSASPIEFLF